MLKSLSILFKSPYNKKRIFSAIKRFIIWKYIRLFKLENQKRLFWNDRYILINYDSFQSMWLMYNYIVDWEEFLFIYNYLDQYSIAFDVGSNMGFYTIWMSKLISKEGSIHAFEPDKKNFERLSKNISLIADGPVINLNNIALSSEDGISRLTVGLDGENHIINHFNLDNSVEIMVSSIDIYSRLNKITCIDFLKIDVEGFEFEVLKGAVTLLEAKQIHVIQLEINDSIINSGIQKSQLIEFVNNLKYDFYSYDYKENKMLKTDLHSNRENYFLLNDLNQVNNRLQENVRWKKSIHSL